MAQITPRTHSHHFSGEERDIRVEDYLNDKLQTTVDLDNLDPLLKNVHDQQNLLKEQVCSLNTLHSDTLSSSLHSSFERPK